MDTTTNEIAQPGQVTDAGLARKLEEHCAKAEQFLAKERLRMESVESELFARLAAMAARADRPSEQADPTSQREASLLRKQAAELKEAEQELEWARTALAQHEAEIAKAADEQDRRREQLDQKAELLAAESERVEQQRAATQEQRQRIAQEFKQRRAELFRKLEEELARAKSQQTATEVHTAADEAIAKERDDLLLLCHELEKRLAEQLDRQQDSVANREALEKALSERDELAELCQDLTERFAEQFSDNNPPVDEEVVETLRRDLSQLSDELDETRRERDDLITRCRELESWASKSSAKDEVVTASLKLVEDERDQLAGTCDELRQQLEEFQEAAGTGSDKPENDLEMELEDAQRRYDMAIEELRDQNERIAELEDEVAKAKQPKSAVAGTLPANNTFDWESQKQRLMAALEQGESPQSEHDHETRATIEEAIRTTDEVIDAKQREIDELKNQLAQAGSPIATGEGAADLQHEPLSADLVETHELIQQERQKLLELQEAMREKQRKAEVEISLERAKLAREKAALEDQLAHLNRQKEKLGKADVRGELDPTRQSGGRWLKRLGLSDD